MAEDHNGLNNGRLDEAAYLLQCELVLDERERMMQFELGRFHRGFFLYAVRHVRTGCSTCSGGSATRSIPVFNPDLSTELATRIEQHYPPL